MIKIIKEGTKNRLTCEYCGCVFSFEDEDLIHLEPRRDENGNYVYDVRVKGLLNGYKRFIVCPQCDKETEIKEKDSDPTHEQKAGERYDIKVGDEIICKGTQSKKVVLKINRYWKGKTVYTCFNEITGMSCETDPQKNRPSLFKGG